MSRETSNARRSQHGRRAEIRRENLREVVRLIGGPQRLGELLGYDSGAFISQMTSDPPIRPVTENTAERIERVLNLEEGTLNLPPSECAQKLSHLAQTNPRRRPAPAASGDAVAISIVLQALQDRAAEIPLSKHAEIIAFFVSERSAGIPVTRERVDRVLTLVAGGAG